MSRRIVESGGRTYEVRDTPLLDLKPGDTIPGYGPDYGAYHPTRWLITGPTIDLGPDKVGQWLAREVYDVCLDSYYCMIERNVGRGTFTTTTREVYR